MSTVPAVTIGGNDLTAWLQDRSMSIKRNSFDATFRDVDGTITAIPALGDTVSVDVPAWAGVVNSVISTGYKGNHPFYRVRATNADPLPDAGAAPFNLADTGTQYSSPAGFKDLEVTRILDNAVEEVRSKCIIFKEGVTWGMEIDITSVVEGYTAETFTVMEMTVDWPIVDGATYTLDLGLGVYTDAVEGPPGAEGTPDDPFLAPPTLEDEIGRISRENCCDEHGGPLSGGGDLGFTVLTGGACDAWAAYFVKRQDDQQGTYTESLTAIGATTPKIASAVYYNAPYTDPAYGCFLGGGSWLGYYDQEIWLEFSAPADDPTSYLGVTTTIDCTAVGLTGYAPSYSIRIAQGAAASTRYGQGSTVATGPFSGTVSVTIPRSLIDWGATNCIVLHPDWLCDRPTRFCNAAGYFGNPEDDGRANSGGISGFAFPDDICAYTLGAGVGLAVDVAGVGDVDGSNTAFTLIRWAATGEVLATINGINVPSVEMTLDTGAGTVTFATAPPSGSVVLFTYQAEA